MNIISIQSKAINFLKQLPVLLILIFTGVLTLNSEIVYAQEVPFITIWDTEKPGESNDDQITIPASEEEYVVEWEEVGNSSNSDTFTATGEHTITFPEPGVYQVSITEELTHIKFYNEGDKDKILEVVQWGDIQWETMQFAFFGASNLDVTATDAPDLSQVTDMSGMFADAESMNADIGHWNTENIENMGGLFSGASSFNQDISTWNTENVASMNSMFANATSFNQDLSEWNTDNLTSLFFTFSGASSFDQNLGDWNISNVQDMSLMLDNSGFSTLNYDKTLDGWSVQQVDPEITLDAEGLTFCLSNNARDDLLTAGWEIIGDMQSCESVSTMPELIAPEDAAMIEDDDVILEWEVYEYASEYHVQISTDNNFNDLVADDSEVSITMYPITDFDPNSTYYWRVKAAVFQNSESDWSEVWSFETEAETPEIPQLVSPENGATDVQLNPSLSWEVSEYAEKYTLQYSIDDTFQTGVSEVESITETEIELPELDGLTQYFWRVKAEVSDLESDWSEVWSFTTKEQQLVEPQLVSPEDGATEIDFNPVLSWEESALAITYTLQLSTDENFQTSLTQIGNIEDTETELSELNELTLYYWRVKAVDEDEESDWSEVWSFTTKQAPQDIPLLLSPENGADEVELTPVLSWQESDPEVTYTLQWSQDETFESSFNQEGELTDTSFELPELDELTQYHWRVKAVGDELESNWSEIWSFTTMMATTVDHADLPDEFELSQNYPNPFNPVTQIQYSVPEQAHVRLAVYNSIGQRVATLVSESQSAGRYEVNFDASGLSSGLYLYRLQTDSFTKTRQMLLLK